LVCAKATSPVKCYIADMPTTPFKDIAKRIGRLKDYQTMSHESDRARSHGWWKNLVEHGAWGGRNGNRVGPPTPETLPGIAKLFGTTVEQVSAMVAADWYGVYPDADVSPRALALSPTLDRMGESDAALLETLAKRLACDQGS